MKTSFKLNNQVLLLALAAIYPLQSFGSAGVAQYASGQVTRTAAAGPAGALAKGSPIESGDMIVTGS